MNMPELKISEKRSNAQQDNRSFAQEVLSFESAASFVAWDRIKELLAKGQPAANDEPENYDYTPRPYQPSGAPRPYQPEANTTPDQIGDGTGTSLYQLLETEKRGMLNATEITHCARDFLDQAFPLAGASHRDAATYLIYFQHLLVILENGESCGLQNPAQLIGVNGSKYEPESIHLRNGDLQIELLLCNHGTRGTSDPAGVEDIIIESALDAVIDCINPGQQTITAEAFPMATSGFDTTFQAGYRAQHQGG